MTLYTVVVNTNGSGAGSGVSAPIRGYLQGMRVVFGGTPAATTDTVIAESNSMARTLLTLTDINTSAAYNPQAQAQDGVGVGVTFYSPYYLNGPVSVAVAQGVASTTAAVTVILNVAN